MSLQRMFSYAELMLITLLHIKLLFQKRAGVGVFFYVLNLK